MFRGTLGARAARRAPGPGARPGRTRLAILLAGTLAFPGAGRAGEGPPAPLPFAPGETIDYTVDFRLVHACAARILVGRPSGPVWPLVFQARAEGLLGLLGIRESLVTTWDAETGLPRGSLLQASELGDRHEDRTSFDRAAGTARLQVTRKGRTAERVLAVPADAHDLPSALARLRRTPPTRPGESLEIPVVSGAQQFTLRAEAEGRERVETPAGAFDAVRIRIRLGFEGPFASGGEYRLWLTDDDRRIPVAIDAGFAVGTLRARVTSYASGEEAQAPGGARSGATR
jgi:hypothetical protein